MNTRTKTLLSGVIISSIIGLIACGDQSEDAISSETISVTQPVAASKHDSGQNPVSSLTPLAEPINAPTSIPPTLPTTTPMPAAIPTTVPIATSISKTIPIREELDVGVDIECDTQQLQATMFVASSLPNGAVDAVQEWICISARVFFDRPNLNWEMAGPIYVVMVDRNDLTSTLEVEKSFCSYIVEHYDKGGIRNYGCNPEEEPTDRGCDFGKCLVVDEQGNVHGSSISSNRQEDGFHLFISSSHDWPQHHHGYKTTALHEMFHVFQLSSISDNGYSYEELNEFLGVRSGDDQGKDVPWWQEGTATYLADLHYSLQTNDPDWLIGEATRNLWTDYDDSGRGTIIDRYMESGTKLYNIGYDSDRIIAYSIGFWFVAYLINQVGEDKIYDFYAELEEHGFEKSFEIHFGKTYREHVDDFDIFLSKSRSEILSILPNNPEPTMAITDTSSADQKISYINCNELKNPDGTLNTFPDGGLNDSGNPSYMYVCNYDDGNTNNAIQKMYDQQPVRAQYLIDIGWNQPSLTPDQQLVTATDIPQSMRDEYWEIQNAINDLIGGYPYYIELMYTTDEFSQNVLDTLEEVSFMDDNPVSSIEELNEVAGCLIGSSIKVDSLGREIIYSLCIQKYPWIEGWESFNAMYDQDGNMVRSFSEDEYRLWLYHGWIHEYFHHYQGRTGLGKNGDMDQHNSVGIPMWWGEGSAIILPHLWLNRNWYKLSQFKGYSILDALENTEWPEFINLDRWYYTKITEAQNESDDSGQCYKNHYFGPSEEYYGGTNCWLGFANAYLAYLTSYQVLWVDIPSDYYELGFERSFEKHTSMTLDEFYVKFNAFIREADPNNPPEGFFPKEPIDSYVTFPKPLN